MGSVCGVLRSLCSPIRCTQCGWLGVQTPVMMPLGRPSAPLHFLYAVHTVPATHAVVLLSLTCTVTMAGAHGAQHWRRQRGFPPECYRCGLASDAAGTPGPRRGCPSTHAGRCQQPPAAAQQPARVAPSGCGQPYLPPSGDVAPPPNQPDETAGYQPNCGVRGDWGQAALVPAAEVVATPQVDPAAEPAEPGHEPQVCYTHTSKHVRHRLFLDVWVRQPDAFGHLRWTSEGTTRCAFERVFDTYTYNVHCTVLGSQCRVAPVLQMFNTSNVLMATQLG